jgi:dipeptidyl aminopeptidase/acylaminoacyl peptidase
MKLPCTLALVVVTIAVPVSRLLAQRPITARDCVTVRDLQHDDSTFRSTIKISPDGSQVAYPVKSPNLKTNENEIALYVRKLPTDSQNSGRPILVGDISAVRWLSDNRHLTMLMKENGRWAVGQVDSVTADRQVLVQSKADITEYSTNRDASTVVYVTEAASASAGEENLPTAQETATGYRIPFKRSTSVLYLGENLFVTRRTHNGWSTPEAIIITSPLSNQPLTALTNLGGHITPTLSPDGKQLLVSYSDFSDKMPDEWRKSGFMQHRNSAGVIQAFHLLVLYDLDTKETKIPLKTPWVIYVPLWAADGKSFVVVAHPPIGSELEQENLKNGRIAHSTGARVFWIEPGNAKVEDVASRLVYPFEGPLGWTENGDLLVRVTSLDTITRYSHNGTAWQQVSSFQIPVQMGNQVATDGNYVVGDFNNTLTPPQLFLYRPGDKQVQVFAKLNPQFDQLTLAQAKEVHWKTSSGFDATGLLLLPPNYEPKVKYPLVIQTKPFATAFVCSFGNFPSFAPQPIANSGIMYLGQIATKGSTQREEDYYPKGYPGPQGAGSIAEAAFAMDLWDRAVEALDKQGLVDSNRVGIIGFSRTGWYTEFILAHSKVHYRAATVTDNVQYSLGEYWLKHDEGTFKMYDTTYGGPPYGATLKNWLDNSVSFNLDKIHTPLLMEQMGYGRPYDNPVAPPIYLTVAFEVFAGLNRLNKPVELYYYPNEDHEPDHPQARFATMQRNVDWYRFWLQRYERPNPEDPEQNVRWRKLRDLQHEDEKNSGPRATSVYGLQQSEE